MAHHWYLQATTKVVHSETLLSTAFPGIRRDIGAKRDQIRGCLRKFLHNLNGFREIGLGSILHLSFRNRELDEDDQVSC